MQKTAPAASIRKEDAQGIVYTAYRLNIQIPNCLSRWLSKKAEVPLVGKPMTRITVEVPDEITPQQLKALQELGQKVRITEFKGNALAGGARQPLCTIDKAIERLVKNGGWNSLRLGDYLDIEGAQKLARDLYGKRNQLQLNSDSGPFNPQTIGKMFKKALEEKGKPVKIQYTHLPWKTYFCIKKILLAEPESYKGIDGMIKLAKKLRAEARMAVHLRDLFNAGSAIEKVGDIKLGWQLISLPFMEFLYIERKTNEGNYFGIDGMLKLAKEMGVVNLTQLFSAGSAIEKVGTMKLGWHDIKLAYKVYIEGRELLLQDKKTFTGKDGWKKLMEQISYAGNKEAFVYAFKSREAKELGWVL